MKALGGVALGWTQNLSWDDGLKEMVDWYTANGEQSGYWGNLSGALVAHPTGGKPSVVGTVYQNLEDLVAGHAAEEAAKNGVVVDASEEKPVFLVYGRTGWIGGKVGKLLTEQGHTWYYGSARLQDRRALAEVETSHPPRCEPSIIEFTGIV